MKSPLIFSLVVLSSLLLIAAGSDDRGKGGGGSPVEPAVVPEYLFNIVLGRPGADSMTASVLAWKDMEGSISFGENANDLSHHTPTFKLTAGEPKLVVMDGLKADTGYFYRFNYRVGNEKPVSNSTCEFHTQRSTNASFRFDVQADSHLDTGTDENVYQRTLLNMLSDKADFMIDLGDTSMVDKFGRFFLLAKSQYLAQRYYLGLLGQSTPVFLVLGNHDGEDGSRLNGQPDSMPLWSLGMRKKYFPNPEPGGIFTGNSTSREGVGLLQDYYAWEWGNALFVVLDPFWPTIQRKGNDNWGMTLGEEQYRWLEKTLENSRAPFKFIFIHHLVGAPGRDSRGGIAVAPYGEWGGKNSDGSEGFSEHRPGWEMPLHQLFVKNGVSIVFHGHDHLFAKEELDGIIYQDVPQPSHPNGGTRSAAEYGYTGVILGSAGHLRVTVGQQETEVEYVRAGVPGITRDVSANGIVDHRYKISPKNCKASQVHTP